MARREQIEQTEFQNKETKNKVDNLEEIIRQLEKSEGNNDI